MKQPGKQPKPGVSPRLISRARDFKANFLELLSTRISAAEAARTAGKSAADDVNAAATAAGAVYEFGQPVLANAIRPSRNSSWFVKGAGRRGAVVKSLNGADLCYRLGLFLDVDFHG